MSYFLIYRKDNSKYCQCKGLCSCLEKILVGNHKNGVINVIEYNFHFHGLLLSFAQDNYYIFFGFAHISFIKFYFWLTKPYPGTQLLYLSCSSKDIVVSNDNISVNNLKSVHLSICTKRSGRLRLFNSRIAIWLHYSSKS